MKNFLKMTLATLVGLILFSFVGIFIFSSVIGAMAALGKSDPIIPAEGMLELDMTAFVLAEQDQEADPFTTIKSGEQAPATVGMLKAVNAIKTAAEDPGVKFIYMKPDMVIGGTAHIEELRAALVDFRLSGKPIVSYIETPTNAGYYLASVSDKIYMSSYDGTSNMMTGVSSQLIFLKDLLDKLGINIQLIRHGKYKSAGEMFIRSTSSKENLEQNKAMINSVWASWAGKIAESRGITFDQFNALINDLKLNFAEDFLNNGLVDELVTRDQMEEKLASLYLAEKFSQVKVIPFAGYAKAKFSNDYKKKNKVAIIYADGEIVDGKAKKQVAGDRFAEIIAKVRQDTTVKAVVLRVNSPGGSVLASSKIKTELDLLRESVPVIASYGNYAASGGYWISANTDKIFSNATTLTGSIGVFSMIPDISGVLKNKLHVNVTTVNSNDHSDMYTLIKPLDAAEKAYMQASVENIYNRFTSIVADGRDMTVEEVDAIAQGRVWTGAEAEGIGLVDQIGTLTDALNYAAISIEGVESLNDVQILEYPKPQTSVEMLLEMFGNGESVFAGTPFENVENAFRGWNESQAGKVYARMPYEITIR
jgi:protease-4